MSGSTSKVWKFEPLDSWFFRDASPYNAGEGGQSGAGVVFPPFMNTVQGAVRIALAHGRGWTWGCDERWPAELGTPEELGEVKLAGPYVLKHGEILYPAPLCLLCRSSSGGDAPLYVRLKPGEAVESDIGLRRFPVASPRLSDLKAAEGLWLDATGMERVLDGGVPVAEQVYRQGDLWTEEGRTGLTRDATRRTALTGHLYSCRHVRLRDGVSLGVLVRGVPEDWHPAVPRLVPLGGEGRMAVCTVSDAGVPLVRPGRPAPCGGKVRFTVTLLTPGRYRDTRRALLQGPPGVPGKCVAACTGKTVPAGGWDSRHRRPRPLGPMIPAGSTWFFEAEERLADEITALHGSNNGDPWGFGQILIGSWRE